MLNQLASNHLYTCSYRVIIESLEHLHIMHEIQSSDLLASWKAEALPEAVRGPPAEPHATTRLVYISASCLFPHATVSILLYAVGRLYLYISIDHHSLLGIFPHTESYMSRNLAPACDHAALCLESSAYAAEAEFERPTEAQRLAAAKPKKQSKQAQPDPCEDDPKTFPAPLMLPGDDLAEDSDCPPQSFQRWLDGKHRNAVTRRRRVVYVVTAPQIDDDVAFMKSWAKPQGLSPKDQTRSPCPDDIRDYMAAFYHGLPVQALPVSPSFVPWEEKKKASKGSSPQYIGLEAAGDCTRIRVRPSPDGIYGGQLNLDDLLDAAIRILPSDAYALILLVDHDLYEDEEDEFVCGRAYGGSRVAVVSSARYNPDLDEYQDIQRLHAWPASHCQEYVSMCCDEFLPKPKVQKKSKSTKASKAIKPNAVPSGPMEAALAAYRNLPFSTLSPSARTALWLGRICRTGSHELGHCFGIAHCSYYACSMQGTASICEDARQPPYLCPVDLAKVLHVTSSTESERYHALLSFCERPGMKSTHFFAPFAAWIRARLYESAGQAA